MLSDAAARAVGAYGGPDLWTAASKLKAEISAGGLAFRLKGQRAFNRIQIRADVKRPTVRLDPVDRSGNTGILDGIGVRLESPGGSVLESRDNPRSFFPCGRRLFRWDLLDQVYFAGYALWNYFTLPALLLRDDIRWEEPESGTLKAEFPDTIPTHCANQRFFFDTDTGLLERHDYTAEVMGNWAKAAHLILEHNHQEGLTFPSRRRVYPKGPGGKPLGHPVLIWIEVHGMTVNGQ